MRHMEWLVRRTKSKNAIHLTQREAQKLLGTLTMHQLNDFSTLKAILTQRFNPQEREIAFRCEFRNRRRNKGETVADYGYQPRKLGHKAYPSTIYSMLEMYIIDQYINGLGNYELQKHVQFGHPQTLDQAIALATEFGALEGSVDRIKKPQSAEPYGHTHTHSAPQSVVM